MRARACGSSTRAEPRKGLIGKQAPRRAAVVRDNRHDRARANRPPSPFETGRDAFWPNASLLGILAGLAPASRGWHDARLWRWVLSRDGCFRGEKDWHYPVVADAGRRGMICRSGWHEALPQHPASLPDFFPLKAGRATWQCGQRSRSNCGKRFISFVLWWLTPELTGRRPATLVSDSAPNRRSG